MVLHLEIQVHVVGGDGGLGSLRGGDQSGMALRHYSLHVAVLVEIHPQLVGGVLQLARGWLVRPMSVQSVDVADLLVVLKLDQGVLAFHRHGVADQPAPRAEGDIRISLAIHHAPRLNEHGLGVRRFGHIVHLHVRLHLQLVRLGIVSRPRGLAVSPLEREGGRPVGVRAMVVRVQRQPGGFDGHQFAFRLSGPRNRFRHLRLVVGPAILGPMHLDRSGHVQRDPRGALAVQAMVRFKEYRLRALHQVVAVAAPARQPQLDAVQLGAGRILHFPHIHRADPGGDAVVVLGVCFGEFPALGGGMQIVRQFFRPGGRGFPSDPLLRTVSKSYTAQNGGNRHQQEPASASHGITLI